MQADWSGSETSSKIWQLPVQTGKETWMKEDEEGLGRKHNLPRGFCHGKPNRINKATSLVCFFYRSFSVYRWGIGNHCVTEQKCPSHQSCTQTGGIDCSGAFQQSSLPFWNSPSLITSFAWSLSYGNFPSGASIRWVHSHLLTEKVGPLLQPFTWPSSWQEDLCWHPRIQSLESSQPHKRAIITCQTQYQRWDLALDTEGRNLTAPLSILQGPLLTLMMKQLQKAQGACWIEPHQTLTLQGRMWMTLTWTQSLETVSHAQTWIKCPSKLAIRGIGRGYGFSTDWSKAISQWKLNWKGSMRITRKCGDMTMNVSQQSGNMLWQKIATPSRCEKWWSELTTCPALLRLLVLKFTQENQKAETDGRVRTLVLSLKQYHTHYYWFYEKGTMRAIVGLQGLHTNNAFQCSNVSLSIRLKSFCLWCFKLGGNTENIEVHYRMATACDICKALASMSAQVILEHCAGCKTKLHRKKSKSKDQEKAQSQSEWHW